MSILRAPCQASVQIILVEVGSQIRAGEEVMQLESMKVSIPICSDNAGVVAKIFVQEGELVDEGSNLVEIL